LILNIRDGAFAYYKRHVKGNEDTSYEMACKKLTRNWELARYKTEMPGRPERQRGFYGNLCLVKEGNEIVWLNNMSPVIHRFKMDKQRYIELNKELGIVESEENTYRTIEYDNGSEC
jgi:hypothetical protein